jgi:hypothetical protein
LLLPSTVNELIAVAVNHQHTHCRFRQPSTHSSPRRQPSTHSSLLPSTINALIAGAATIEALIAITLNHQRTHRRRHQPSPSTINTLIAVAGNH